MDKEFIIQLSLDDIIGDYGVDDFNTLICSKTHPYLQDIEWEITSGEGVELTLKIQGFVDLEDED